MAESDQVMGDTIKGLNQKVADLKALVASDAVDKSLILQGIQTAIDQIDAEEYTEAKATLQDLLDTYGGS